MSTIHESIVLVGGGGGVYRVARFLKQIRLNITTMQTMFDAGGHSKRLRDERGMLPPGDIRQAILALSDDAIEDSMRVLLSYRFAEKNGTSLDHATVGNIMLTALTEHYGGNIIVAINELCKICRVRGRVLPVSLDNADLCVQLSDGSILKGEGVIDTRIITDDRTITSAYLEPAAHIYTEAYTALVNADKIVFCPGDLFTSIIPNPLVVGFKEAMAETKAQIIFVTNIMTKKAETHGYTASRFASTLLSYIGRDRFDLVLCNNHRITEDARLRYEKEGSHPVEIDEQELHKYCRHMIACNLVDQAGGVIRHSEKVASVIAET